MNTRFKKIKKKTWHDQGLVNIVFFCQHCSIPKLRATREQYSQRPPISRSDTSLGSPIRERHFNVSRHTSLIPDRDMVHLLYTFIPWSFHLKLQHCPETPRHERASATYGTISHFPDQRFLLVIQSESGISMLSDRPPIFRSTFLKFRAGEVKFGDQPG